MPKIIIREIDNTTAGSVDYTNFNVVVPGFIADGTNKLETSLYKQYLGADGKYHDRGTYEDGTSVFDDNGVYECNSQKDFEKYIGKKAGGISPMSGTWATLADIKEDGENPVYFRKLNYHEYYRLFEGRVCAKEIISDKTAGYMKTEIGSTHYKLTLVEGMPWNEDYEYGVLETEDSRGSDPVTEAYNGNQIAYELLGLGYTVLYKKITSTITELNTADFWECFKDKSNYDFRYLTTGGYFNAEAYNCICNVASHNKTEDLDHPVIDNGRGDCIALIDVADSELSAVSVVEDIKAYVKNLGINNLNQYAAIFCPQVTYAGKGDEDYKKNLTFPASFHYLACAAYARNELNFAEWYATAGYTRGVCNKSIAKTSFKLGEMAINALQPRISDGQLYHAVNVITNVHGNYYMWGNRTAYKLNTEGLVASHFLNVRQLCSTLKQHIYSACRSLTFDPNSDRLWGAFCNKLKPILEKMKADQGIQDYKIIKVKSTKKALLTAKIRIVPIEAVEDFDISVYLEDSVAGVTVAADEE